MNVEDHVLSLHFLEHGVELFVRHYALRGICCYSLRIGFDPTDASVLCFLYNFRCDTWVQVQRHQVGHIRFQFLEPPLVVKCVADCCDGWNKVWLKKCLTLTRNFCEKNAHHYEDHVNSSLADGRSAFVSFCL